MEKKEFTKKLGGGLFETVNAWQTDAHHFSDLTEEQQGILLQWIKSNFVNAPRADGATFLTTYSIKQSFTDSGRGPFFVYDNQMKEAFWKLGFRPVSAEEFHWSIKLSPKSPYLKEWH